MDSVWIVISTRQKVCTVSLTSPCRSSCFVADEIPPHELLLSCNVRVLKTLQPLIRFPSCCDGLQPFVHGGIVQFQNLLFIFKEVVIQSIKCVITLFELVSHLLLKMYKLVLFLWRHGVVINVVSVFPHVPCNVPNLIDELS